MDLIRSFSCQDIILGAPGSELVLEFMRGNRPYLLPLKRKTIQDAGIERVITMDNALFHELAVPSPPRSHGKRPSFTLRPLPYPLGSPHVK